MQLLDSMPEFSLTGTDNNQYSSSNIQGKNGTAVIFTCNHCPYARAYITRIGELINFYESKGFGFYAINSNDPIQYPEDSFDKMIPMGEALRLNGKYLVDETQNIAKAFNAGRTPEAFLFDQNNQLSYHGAIDDNWAEANEVKETYLIDALDALLAEKPVAIQETPAVGCSIKWKPGQ